MPNNYTEALDADASTRLAHILRVIFPHDGLDDGPYQRSAAAIIESAGTSVRQAGIITEGMRSLETLAGGDLAALDADTLGVILHHIERTEFFTLLLQSSVVTLYSDHEVWGYLGYEGYSSDKGGYQHHGFDDIDWLPAPI
jgi:hypothetical protein